MRDSQTGQITIWALNFDNDADKSINLALLGIDVASIATLNIINNPNDLDLDSAMGNWTVQQIQNFNGDNFQLDIPQASLMMLQVQAIPEPASMTLLGIGLIALLARRKAARNV
jgi:alpha-L-arabinofuranosidase